MKVHPLTVAAIVALAAPAGAATIVGAAQQAGTFTRLLAASRQAGVDGALNGPGPFTIFAPNDAAFGKVPRARLDKLMQPGNLTMLKRRSVRTC